MVRWMNLYIDFTAEITAGMEKTIKNELNQMLELTKKEWSVKYVYISIKPYEKL